MKGLITATIIATLTLVFNINAFAETNTPKAVALEFAEAYYMLDKSFENFLCKECKLDEDENKISDIFFNKIQKKSENMGYKPGFLKSTLSNMKAEILVSDESSAKVNIIGKRSRSINTLYNLVGRLFCLIETYDVDEVVNLVKVEGKWKVKDLSIDIM